MARHCGLTLELSNGVNMKSILRSLAAIGREIPENICLRILPVKWSKRYLYGKLDNCGALRIDRRVLLLTKLISVASRAGEIGNAEKAAREILSIMPDDPWSPVELAMILEKQGRLSEAKELYQRILTAPSASAAFRAKASSEVERLTALEG